MAETGQDFTLYTGDDKRPEIHVVDQEGNKVDLTNMSVEWVATDPADDSVVISKTSGGDGISINDAENGKFIIRIDGDDTSTVADDITLEHEARVINDSGITVHVTTGQINVIASHFA